MIKSPVNKTTEWCADLCALACACKMFSLIIRVWLDNFCIKKMIAIMIEEDRGIFHDHVF